MRKTPGVRGQRPRGCGRVQPHAQQLLRRVPAEIVRRVLERFNAGEMVAAEACARLGVGKTRLYQLRHAWLRDRIGFVPGMSGGDRSGRWPTEVEDLAKGLLKAGPPNYALAADEIGRRLAFRKSRSAVGRYAAKHWPEVAHDVHPGRKSWRRWQCDTAGGIWQHDSTPVWAWEAPDPQHLLLTLDDCTREVVGITLVERESLWEHFSHLRRAFERHGVPEMLYTDGLSLFGHGGADIVTRCGRALRALGVAHRVAPTPQAKGKIERQIGTFQRRIETLCAYDHIDSFPAMQPFADAQADYWNSDHTNATTGLTPAKAKLLAKTEGRCVYRPCPPSSLLDLHLAWHESRRVSAGTRVEYQGRTWIITPTPLVYVWLVTHPGIRFWVVSSRPDPLQPQWPNILGHYKLARK